MALATIIHQPGAIGHQDIGSGRCMSLSSSVWSVKAGLFKAGAFMMFYYTPALTEKRNEIVLYCPYR